MKKVKSKVSTSLTSPKIGQKFALIILEVNVGQIPRKIPPSFFASIARNSIVKAAKFSVVGAAHRFAPVAIFTRKAISQIQVMEV